MSYWYLASPYSKYPDGPHAAYKVACEAAALLIKAGVPVFSPIAHSHGVAFEGGVDPMDHEIWLPADRPMMDMARGIIVLKAAGWEDSYGVNYEIRVFEEADKPVLFMTPGELPKGLV